MAQAIENYTTIRNVMENVFTEKKHVGGIELSTKQLSLQERMANSYNFIRKLGGKPERMGEREGEKKSGFISTVSYYS